MTAQFGGTQVEGRHFDLYLLKLVYKRYVVDNRGAIAIRRWLWLEETPSCYISMGLSILMTLFAMMGFAAFIAMTVVAISDPDTSSTDITEGITAVVILLMMGVPALFFDLYSRLVCWRVLRQIRKGSLVLSPRQAWYC